MDVFSINRYTDTNDEDDIRLRETLRLQKLKKEIEERKKNYKPTNSRSDQTLVQPGPSMELQRSNESLSEVNDFEQRMNTLKKLFDNTIKLTSNIKFDKPANEFKVLGSTNFEKKSEVDRVLPYWISDPYRISKNLQNLTCLVKDQDWLHSTLKATLAREGVTYLFPVQEQVIPFILDEHLPTELFKAHDICVCAPTGSGKTLSFVLPIVQILMEGMVRDYTGRVRALIILPVQELATQVAKVFKKYCTNTCLKVALLSGSKPLQQEQQQIMKYIQSAGWITNVDIIVCTAGRLVEHMHSTKGFSLKHLKFLVVDEADRIMDNFQNDWLSNMYKHIQTAMDLKKIPAVNLHEMCRLDSGINKLLFSATLSPDPELLEQWGLFEPKLFTVEPINEISNKNMIKKYTTPDELQEQYVVCTAEEKPLVFYYFFANLKWDKTLCFTNSAQSAHRLTSLLNIWGNGKLKVAELSASLDRPKRDAVLKGFLKSDTDVIISTDALARGIDIPDCNYVISYDPPRNIKSYVHRVGRTGRAGRNGTAVTVLTHNQVNMFKEILQSSGKSCIQQLEVQQDVLDDLSIDYEKAIAETKKLIIEEVNEKVKKSIELKRAAKPKTRKRKHYIPNNSLE